MQFLATTAQMKELDRTAIQERGIPSLELMECAAQETADILFDRLPRRGDGRNTARFVIGRADGPLTPEEEEQLQQAQTMMEQRDRDSAHRIAVFCGPGNNGGDGIAAARLLMDKGCTVRAFLVGDREKMTPDAKAMEQRLLEVGGVLEPYRPNDWLLSLWLTTCDGVVDALFGVGLARPVEGDFRTAIEQINHLHSRFCPVISCDIPSGVHGDTGEVLGVAVRADVTVTFSCAKPGLFLGEGGACAGDVLTAPIGIPEDLIYQQIIRQPQPVVGMARGIYGLPRRPRTAHKGDFGKVFVLAGSEGYTGAPVLASKAAVRSGAGLVFLGVPRDVYPIVAVKCDEAMPFPLPEEYDKILKKAQGCDVALIGPGLGRAPETEKLVHRLLTDLEIPVVLDADGINALQGHIDVLDKRKALTVLTPHDGEFQRLTGCSLPIADRLSAAREFAQAHHCVLVLKGHGTVTASPEGKCWICAAGNPGMAKGGCGDVLAGMTAALLGQKHLWACCPDGAELTARAVYYHAQAGDRCAQALGEYGMTPSDMIQTLPEVLKEHEAPD